MESVILMNTTEKIPSHITRVIKNTQAGHNMYGNSHTTSKIKKWLILLKWLTSL